MLAIAELWDSNSETEWLSALERYWDFVQPRNLAVEREFDSLDASAIAHLDAEGWYTFLLDKYFRWKYTAPNRYGSTTKHLRRYVETNTLDELYAIKSQLFSFDQEDIAHGLTIAERIKGLGIAGASGLLALLFPTKFATVDQFVVQALRKVNNLEQKHLLERMNPEGLRLNDGVVLIRIMRAKAQESNRRTSSTFWTPRKIDMVLWTAGR